MNRIVLLCCLTLGLFGCAVARDARHGTVERAPAQPWESWDQANLKMRDHGCPTAIFVTPGGNLVQCQDVVGVTQQGPAAFGKPAPATFDTRDKAAMIALQIAYSISPYYEHGGVLIQRPDGKFVIGVPDTEYAGDHVETDVDPADYTDTGTIVAIYHTHPCLKNTHGVAYFSVMDLQTARINTHPSYMANLCTGEVHLYDPAKDAVPAHGVKFSGQIIGKFPVAGDVLDENETR